MATKVTLWIDDYELNRIRSYFEVPEKVLDGPLAQALVGDLVRRYFSLEYWNREGVDLIVDDILHE